MVKQIQKTHTRSKLQQQTKNLLKNPKKIFNTKHTHTEYIITITMYT